MSLPSNRTRSIAPLQQSADAFLSALFSGADAGSLFSKTALWRDYLSTAWDLQTHEGVDAIRAALPREMGHQIAPCDIISDTEFLFYFEGPHGTSKGLAEMNEGRCVRLFTSLEAPRKTASGDADGAPFVLIIGGGQSGLALGAQLAHLKIPYLIVEKNPRIGDNWRKRYESLILHDPVWVNHLPFKPFPDEWPLFTPKDKMADWLEDYADSLGLNVRCASAVRHAQYDAQDKAWHITLAQDNEIISVTVGHIVFAVGTSGFAHKPEFEGASLFDGAQMHSSDYVSGAPFNGQNVAIIGATNSAHDIAVDLVKHGAKPTLIQRSSTHVVPHEVYINDILAPLYEPSHKRLLADCDFMSLATPLRHLEDKARVIFKQAQQKFAGFYDSLEAAGFKIDFAEDGTGIIGKYRRSASGYYIDVGGSRFVANKTIAVKSGVGVTALTADGVRLSDDSVLAADSVIYATGFGSMEEWVARLIDQKTADKIGKCWGYGSGYRGDPGPFVGELRNMWKPTAQEGLWFMGGNLAQGRIYSRYLALQLAHHSITRTK